MKNIVRFFRLFLWIKAAAVSAFSAAITETVSEADFVKKPAQLKKVAKSFNSENSVYLTVFGFDANDVLRPVAVPWLTIYPLRYFLIVWRQLRWRVLVLLLKHPSSGAYVRKYNHVMRQAAWQECWILRQRKGGRQS